MQVFPAMGGKECGTLTLVEYLSGVRHKVHPTRLPSARFMSTDIHITDTEVIILNLLMHHGDQYGLELVRSSDGALKRGTVYVLLSRIQDKGLVESKLVSPKEGERGPARRQFSITGLGQQVLQQTVQRKSSFWSQLIPRSIGGISFG